MTHSHTFFDPARILHNSQYNRIMAAHSPAANTREYPLYPLRAQVVGTLTYVCPYCGRITRTQITPTTYKVHCKGRGCSRKLFAIGLRFSPMRPGPEQPIPIDTFPVAEWFDMEKSNKRFHIMSEQASGNPTTNQVTSTTSLRENLLSPTSADAGMSCDTDVAPGDPAGAD